MVDKMTLHHLAEFSPRINCDISELIRINEELMSLLENSKLGVENKRILFNQIKRLLQVVHGIRHYGNTISLNLAGNDLLDDGSADGVASTTEYLALDGNATRLCGQGPSRTTK